MTDLTVRIAGKNFKNPVWAASGTFGCGEELERFVDLRNIGAIVTKTVTLGEREGNPPPRVIETASGLLNSVGLENKGAEWFVKNKYPFLKQCGTNVVVSFAAFTPGEWVKCAEILTDGDFPDAFEINLSCPNVSYGAARGLVAQDKRAVEKVLRAVKAVTRVPLIAKLTPNVTDIGEIAVRAESSGADAVAVANTFQGVAVDAETMKPYFKRVVAGLSGPAIKPLALKAVMDAYRQVKVPVVGIGGIMTGIDAAEFMLCGAAAVEVGTATLRDPCSCSRVLEELQEYLKTKGVKKARELTGRAAKQKGLPRAISKNRKRNVI